MSHYVITQPFLFNDCLKAALPRFFECVDLYQPELLQVPLFSGLFTRPSPVLVKALEKIRARYELPMLAPGTESQAGAWGLRTPGYFIIAFHFRSIPLGFEPMAKVCLKRWCFCMYTRARLNISFFLALVFLGNSFKIRGD